MNDEQLVNLIRNHTFLNFDALANAQRAIRDKRNEFQTKSLSRLLRYVYGFVSCNIRYSRVKNFDDDAEIADVEIVFKEFTLRAKYTGYSNDDTRIETNIGTVIIEDGIEDKSKEVPFKTPSVEEWTKEDVNVLIRAVGREVMEIYPDTISETALGLIRTETGKLEIKPSGNTIEQDDALCFEMYDKLTPLLKFDDFDDFSIDYSRTKHTERSTLKLFYKERFVRNIVFQWDQSFGILTKSAMHANVNVNDLEQKVDPEILRVMMPVHGERMIEFRRKVKEVGDDLTRAGNFL
jgi:hypothetical protein